MTRLSIIEDKDNKFRGNNGTWVAEISTPCGTHKIGHMGITSYLSFRSQVAKHCKANCIPAVTIRERADMERFSEECPYYT